MVESVKRSLLMTIGAAFFVVVVIYIIWKYDTFGWLARTYHELA